MPTWTAFCRLTLSEVTSEDVVEFMKNEFRNDRLVMSVVEKEA